MTKSSLGNVINVDLATYIIIKSTIATEPSRIKELMKLGSEQTKFLNLINQK